MGSRNKSERPSARRNANGREGGEDLRRKRTSDNRCREGALGGAQRTPADGRACGDRAPCQAGGAHGTGRREGDRTASAYASAGGPVLRTG